nr:hypothetical protein Iba_chr01eCG3810 [Ipomoea batatas]
MPSMFSREAILAILAFGDIEDALNKPFFPLGGLSPFKANSSTCLKTASSSANAALTWLCFSYS